MEFIAEEGQHAKTERLEQARREAADGGSVGDRLLRRQGLAHISILERQAVATRVGLCTRRLRQ